MTYTAISAMEGEVPGVEAQNDPNLRELRQQHRSVVDALSALESASRLSDSVRSFVHLWRRAQGGEDVGDRMEGLVRDMQGSQARFENAATRDGRG